MANITLALKYTRRVLGTDDHGKPYDFVSIAAKTDDGKWAELKLTPQEYAGISESIGVLDKISFANVVVEPRKDGRTDRNGNPVLNVTAVDWTEAVVKRAPFKSTMPSLETLTHIARSRASATAQPSRVEECAIA